MIAVVYEKCERAHLAYINEYQLDTKELLCGSDSALTVTSDLKVERLMSYLPFKHNDAYQPLINATSVTLDWWRGCCMNHLIGPSSVIFHYLTLTGYLGKVIVGMQCDVCQTGGM